jgi:outer membrane protein
MRSFQRNLAVVALVAGAAYGQTKVAVVDFQAAVLNTAEIKKAQADLEAKFKPRQEALVKLERELQQIQSQLQTMAGKLTPQAEGELQAQGSRKQREYQRLSEDLQADVERDRNDVVSRSGRQMRDVITKLANEKGFDVVVDSANTLFFKPATDLTKDATAAYDAAYPPK